MTIIHDSRIGSVDKKGMVEKKPTHYATGGFWNQAANATPSTCYFGKDGNYFFVLPILVPTISEKLWDEFYELIDEVRPLPAPRVKKVVAKVEEVREVISGASDNAPAIIKPKAKKPLVLPHDGKNRIEPVEAAEVTEITEDTNTSRPEDDFSSEVTE